MTEPILQVEVSIKRMVPCTTNIFALYLWRLDEAGARLKTEAKRVHFWVHVREREVGKPETALNYVIGVTSPILNQNNQEGLCLYEKPCQKPGMNEGLQGYFDETELQEAAKTALREFPGNSALKQQTEAVSDPVV